MRATYLFGAGDVRVVDVPDASIEESTDAVVRVVRACICGSDLHPFHGAEASVDGIPIGHESIGVVEAVGADAHTIAVGDFVVVPFGWSDGTCQFCREGLHTSCEHGGWIGVGGNGGAQAEALRVPQADGTLVVVPGVDESSELLPSLLTLADVFGTGWHAAAQARVQEGDTVAVIGDGAVGLLAVLSAKLLGVERIILMGRHRARTDLGVEFGATDVVAERDAEGIAKVLELVGPAGGVHKVLEAVGHKPGYDQAVGILRPGGVISRVGVPQYEEAGVGFMSLFGKNATLTGGPAPVRAYADRLLPLVLDGTVDPGRVFDRTIGLDDVPAGYRAMDDREALKVLISF